jgi:hypothetical protein
MLEWLESTSLAIWLGESPSVWSFPTVITLHTMGLAVLAGGSWLLDLRLLGISRNTPLGAFRWVFPVIAIGLVVNVVTGVMLFTKNATTWGTSMPFLIKMVLVAAGVATLVPIRSLVLRSSDSEPGQHLRTDQPQADVRGNARLLAIASIVAWAGAITAGRLLAYLQV